MRFPVSFPKEPMFAMSYPLTFAPFVLVEYFYRPFWTVTIIFVWAYSRSHLQSSIVKWNGQSSDSSKLLSSTLRYSITCTSPCFILSVFAGSKNRRIISFYLKTSIKKTNTFMPRNSLNNKTIPFPAYI